MKLNFRSLHLKNWKNFVEVEASIADRLFLVGPNASGQSNLLDAFRFIKDLASSGGGFQEAIRRRGGVSAVRCLAARRYPDVSVHVSIESSGDPRRWQYELAFNQDNQAGPLFAKNRCAMAAQSSSIVPMKTMKTTLKG